MPSYGYALDTARHSGETAAMPAALRGMAVLPMLFAVFGGLIDERARLGFSQWRSACRASGLTLASILRFTLELLPTAVLGALLGGVVVLGAGILLRHRGCAAGALRAHAACAIGMAVGLLLCVLPLPVPLLLAAELALTLLLASAMTRSGRLTSA
jgi:hypothetical protein